MFNLDIVNAFSTATVTILKNYCNTTVDKGEIRITHSPTPIAGVGIFVGIIGEYDGKVLFAMEQDTAFKLVSVLNEEAMSSIDDIFVGTVKEFANMAAGVAINELSTKDVNLDMTPPTVLIGEHTSVVEKTSESILSINYLTNIGRIRLSVLLSEG